MNPMDLSGKRILVAGASSGIGRACAIYASQLGAAVILTARRGEELEKTRLQMLNPSIHMCVPMALTEDEAASKIVSAAVVGGKLDGLIYSAGLGGMIPLNVLDQGILAKMMSVNYYGFVALMRECVRRRNCNSRFSSAAISSIAAEAGWVSGTAYCGTKGALSATVRALALELHSKGIRVNAVCPSYIRTRMLSEASEANGDEILGKQLEKQPLGVGEPEQVASAVCFLLSDAASFITGVNLPVDGGYLAQ